MKATRYMEEINGIRAVACLLVLAVHVSAGIYYQQGHWDGFTALINQLARFGTPVFAVISGFLLFNQVKGKGFHLGNFIRSRMTKVVLPYLIWSIFYLTLLKYAYQVDHFVSLEHWAMIMVSGRAFYHLYFVVVVIQFYLLFPLIQRWLRSTLSWWLGITVALALNVIYLGMDPSIWGGIFGEGVRYSGKALLPAWIFYFLLGGWLSHHWEPIREWIRTRGSWLLAATIFVIVGGVVEYRMTGLYGSARLMNLLNTPILVLAGVAGWLQWADQCSGVKKRLLALGNLSFGIYLVHPAILMILMETLPPVIWRPVLLPFLYGVVLALTVGGIKLIQLLPFYQYLLTVPTRSIPMGSKGALTSPSSGGTRRVDSPRVSSSHSSRGIGIR